jgi:hypothetical protein
MRWNGFRSTLWTQVLVVLLVGRWPTSISRASANNEAVQSFCHSCSSCDACSVLFSIPFFFCLSRGFKDGILYTKNSMVDPPSFAACIQCRGEGRVSKMASKKARLRHQRARMDAAAENPLRHLLCDGIYALNVKERV